MYAAHIPSEIMLVSNLSENGATPLIWSIDKNSSISHVMMENSVLHIIKKWRQYDLLKQSEACGILMGERRGEYLRVTHISEPLATDYRRPNFYQRSISGHQQILDFLHKSSEGQIQYLGEWHTHPQNMASPSIVDYQEWAKTTALQQFCQTQLIFFIAGITDDWLGVIDHQVLYRGTLLTE